MKPRAPARPARKAGCRKGHAGRAHLRALRHRALFDRRPLPRAGARSAPRSGSRRSSTWTPASSSPTTSSIGVVRGGARARRSARARASCSTASRARCTRPRSSTGARRPSARHRDQHRRAARDRARPPRGPAGLRELPAGVPREHAARRELDCDTCGGHVVQRDDDTEEAIDRRLELYEQETVPIIDYYRGGLAVRWSTVSATATTCSSAWSKAIDERFDRDRRRSGPDARRREQIALMRRAGQRRRGDARGVHARGASRARRPPISTPRPARCSTAGVPVPTSSATTGSRRWPASRPTR